MCVGGPGGANRPVSAQHTRVHHAAGRSAQNLSRWDHQAAAQPPEERQRQQWHRHGNTNTHKHPHATVQLYTLILCEPGVKRQYCGDKIPVM